MTKTEKSWLMTKDLWDKLVAGDVIGVKDTAKSPGKIGHITVLHKKGELLTLSHLFEGGALASAAGVYKYDNRGFAINSGNGKIFNPLTLEIVFIDCQAGKEASAEYTKRKESVHGVDHEKFYSLIEAMSDNMKAIQEVMSDNTMPTIHEKMSVILSHVLGEKKYTEKQFATFCWLAYFYEKKIGELREQAMPMGMHPADILVLAME